MSTAGQPTFPCPGCGHAAADVSCTTNCYVTDIDDKTQTKLNRLNATVYQLKCPQCQHEFSVEVPAD